MIKFESTVPTQYSVGFGVVCFLAGATFREVGQKYLLAYLASCKLLGKNPAPIAVALAQVVSIAVGSLTPDSVATNQTPKDNSVESKIEALLKEYKS